jgi:hypothetical protein
MKTNRALISAALVVALFTNQAADAHGQGGKGGGFGGGGIAGGTQRPPSNPHTMQSNQQNQYGTYGSYCTVSGVGRFGPGSPQPLGARCTVQGDDRPLYGQVTP